MTPEARSIFTSLQSCFNSQWRRYTSDYSNELHTRVAIRLGMQWSDDDHPGYEISLGIRYFAFTYHDRFNNWPDESFLQEKLDELVNDFEKRQRELSSS